MIEILLDNLGYFNKPIYNFHCYFSKNTISEISCDLAAIEFVIKILGNPGFVELLKAYDKNEPGILVISNGTIRYQVIYGEKGIMNESINKNGKIVAVNDIIEDRSTIDKKILLDIIPAGQLLTCTRELIDDFVVVNERTGLDYFTGRGRQRFKRAGVNFCDSTNKYYKRLGFDGVIEPDGSVKHGDSFLYYTSEGSGFLRLLNILPELDYCKATGKILIVPNYTMSLHPVVIKELKNILVELEISAIITKEGDY